MHIEQAYERYENAQLKNIDGSAAVFATRHCRCMLCVVAAPPFLRHGIAVVCVVLRKRRPACDAALPFYALFCGSLIPNGCDNLVVS